MNPQSQPPRSETTTPRKDAVTAAKETADLLFKKYKSRVGDHWSKEDAVLECNFEDALVEFATHCDHLINSLSALPVERSEREKAADRYECLRKMNPRQFQELWNRNIAGEGRFDDLVDQLITNEQPRE